MCVRSFALSEVLLVLCLAAVAGPAWTQEGCKDPRRIVGGKDTDIKDHPWQVALNINGALCGGTVIAQDWVMTASHCFAHYETPGSVRHRQGGESPTTRAVACGRPSNRRFCTTNTTRIQTSTILRS